MTAGDNYWVRVYSQHEIFPSPVASNKKTSTMHCLAFVASFADPEKDLSNFHSWASLLENANSIHSATRILAPLVHTVRWAKLAPRQMQDKRSFLSSTP